MKHLKFIVAGIVFGIVMAKSEAFSWFRIQEMFRFQSFHIRDFKGNPINFFPKEKAFVRYIGGGTIFGLGWGLSGACPGPMVVNIGYGYLSMIIVFLFAIIGTYIYGVVKDKLPH
jgi:uncharacterized membrane protein YedE/YeeE